jgi:VanZ family protein
VTEAPVALRWHLRWLTAGWLMVVAVVLLSLTPNLPLRVDVDKVEHAFAYLVLMSWFGGLSVRRAHGWVALGLFVLGAIIEVAQGWSGYRSADVRDLAADGVGIALGWIMARRLAPAGFAFAERLLAR